MDRDPDSHDNTTSPATGPHPQSHRDEPIAIPGTGHHRDVPMGQRRGQTPSGQAALPAIMPAFLAALVVGIGLTLAGRLEYRCIADLGLEGPGDAAQDAAVRSELVSFVWQQAPSLSGPAPITARWSIEAMENRGLRLSLMSPDRDEGLAAVREMATRFRDHRRRERKAMRSTPSRAEALLTDLVAEWRVNLAATTKAVDAALAELPEDDPTGQRQALAERWAQLQQSFEQDRVQSRSATADVDQLESASEITKAAVTDVERQEAHRADLVLQQDLKELTVALTELKLHLLNVWQDASAPLERLALAANEFVDFFGADPASPPHTSSATFTGTVPRNASQGVVSHAQACAVPARFYQAQLTHFDDEWNREFTAIQRTVIEPSDGDLIQAHLRLLRRFHEFFFEAAKQLSALRAAVDKAGADPSDSARRHVYESDLIRAFQSLQGAHHRLEFAAAAIETPENFRLDSALRQARGLHRRTKAQIRRIEETLEQDAIERVRRQRLEDLAGAKRRVSQTRAQSDRTVDDLIALQEAMHASANRSESYLRGLLNAEIATTRLQVTKARIFETESRLAALAADRTEAAVAGQITIRNCYGPSMPVNLWERLRVGGIAAGLTLVMMLLSQWWIMRHGSSSR